MQAYVKQEWEDKVTVINKSRLEHIEEGIYQVSIVQPEKGDPGKDGITPQFKVADEHIQVSLDGGAKWNNLVPLASITGPKGDTGKSFSIFKTYASVELMTGDLENVPEGSFVLIASSEDDADNAKLYVRGADAFKYLADLSGAQGIQGEAGKNGAPGVTPVITFHVKTLAAGEDATIEQAGSAEAPSVTIGIPKGADGKNGQNGSDGVNGKNGVTFTPSVDPEGNLSWTNDGELKNPDTVNIKGPKGDAPDLTNYVKYQRFVAGESPDERKTIQLANHDNISGVDTNGNGANLIMLSKWDKVDVGSPNHVMNLNAKDGVVQLNDSKVIASTDDLKNYVAKRVTGQGSYSVITDDGNDFSISIIDTNPSGRQTNVSLNTQSVTFMSNYRDSKRKEASLLQMTPDGATLKRMDAAGKLYEVEVVSVASAMQKLPVQVELNLATLEDKVYEDKAIFGWFGVKDLAGLKALVAQPHEYVIMWVSGSAEAGWKSYSIPLQHLTFANNSIKCIAFGINPTDDALSKIVVTINLGGTIAEGNSNVKVEYTPV